MPVMQWEYVIPKNSCTVHIRNTEQQRLTWPSSSPVRSPFQIRASPFRGIRDNATEANVFLADQFMARCLLNLARFLHMHAYLPGYPAVCLSVDGAYSSRKIEIDSYPMDPREVWRLI